MLLALSQNINSSDVFAKYAEARRRLLIFEYDGVVVPYDLYPGLTKPGVDVLAPIKALSNDPRNVVMLLSGRDMEHLDMHWSTMQLILVAENGAYYRVPGGSWQSLFSADNQWIDRISNALNSLSFQFPESFVERKNHSVVWHHRAMKEPIADAELRQILTAITALNRQDQFNVRYDEFSLELSTAGIDAGSFVARWIGGQSFNFILTVGTSRLEEPIFGLFSKEACSVRVGSFQNSRANFHLSSQADVTPFLSQLASFSNSKTAMFC
jgi:trehalose 6-phosphate synthase/phosphatase